ncbi:coiled-coil domain-containing protein 34 [Gastrophryne carolinensis]
MSSRSYESHSAERRRSHSTPQKPTKTGGITSRSKSCDMSRTGDSTSALLSPIYHDSFESDTEDHEFHSRTLKSQSDIHSDQNFDKTRSSSSIEQSLADLHLSPWETWLLNKERQGRIELQKKLSEELKQEEERRKQQEKKEIKKRMAEEQLKEWIQKKQEQERKEKEQKLLIEKQERELEEQKKYLQVKGKEKYQEWLNKKKEEEQERKRKEKEQTERHLAQQREKKEKAEKIFKEWLEQAKNKPRPTLNSYGYINGKLTGYYDGSSYPAPSFYNPIPWKPIPVPPPQKETAKNSNGKKKKRAASSQSYRSTITIPYKPKDNLHVALGLVKR